MAKKVSIKDVASLAGVSISTVSRVINGGPYVSEEKRNSILKAMEQLNFQPNYFAKSLKAGTSNLIAIFVPNINNTVYALIAQGVESIARENRYGVILCNTNEDEEIEREQISRFQTMHIDGYIFATARNDRGYIQELVESGVPAVTVMRHTMDANAVIVDNFKIGYEATTYLINRGHRKIYIFSSTEGIPSLKLRYDGYRKALQDNGLPYEDSYQCAYDDEDITRLSDIVVDWFDKSGKPDAVFSVNWVRAMSIYGAAQRMGFRIPDDVSVLSVDDLPFAPFLNPPLTTVSQPFYDMGRKAAETLLNVIANKNEDGARNTFYQIIMPTTFVERGSVCQREV
ncbi:MAG: LacI family DNA-binding transcriptional regulator [Clostridia bacterium]|nr:LacI family DNA-binding transcriptional regulator [Clostridia bacterium]